MAPILSLHASIVSIYGSPRLHFELLKLLVFLLDFWILLLLFIAAWKICNANKVIRDYDSVEDPGLGVWWTKKIQLKFFLPFLIKAVIYLSLGLLKGQLQEKPSTLKREHPALLFLRSLLPSWIRIWTMIANQNPDPGTPLNPDPDPQHWIMMRNTKNHLFGRYRYLGTYRTGTQIYSRVTGPYS
jgi:hypothetical protein